MSLHSSFCLFKMYHVLCYSINKRLLCVPVHIYLKKNGAYLHWVALADLSKWQQNDITSIISAFLLDFTTGLWVIDNHLPRIKKKWKTLCVVCHTLWRWVSVCVWTEWLVNMNRWHGQIRLKMTQTPSVLIFVEKPCPAWHFS